MKNKRLLLFFLVAIWAVAVWKPAYSQTLNVSIQNVGGNTIQIVGTATAPGFSAGPYLSWGSMNISLRIPKSATTVMPPMVSEFPGASSVVTGESTTFTGATPNDAYTGSIEMSIFDKTVCGLPDDGYWYIQLSGSTGNNQTINTGSSVIIFQFDLPDGWSCAGCVEIMTSNDTALESCNISTQSFIDNSGTLGNVMNIVTNNAPLPIELLTFEVRTDGCDSYLYWETATEQNFGYYQIEASKDGQLFKSIGQQEPQSPNSTEKRVYKYGIPKELQGNYFRLKAVDLDGAYEYSPVVYAEAPCEKDYGMQLYPNPSYVSELTVEISSPQAHEQVRWFLMDSFSKRIQEGKTDLKIGLNKIQIPTENLPSGTYYIQLLGVEALSVPMKFVRSNF